MKNLFRIFAVVLAVSLVFCFTGMIASAEDEFEITNGDFEKTATTSLPDWTVSGGFGTGVFVEEGGPSGEGQCLKLVGQSGSNVSVNKTKAYEFIPGEEYEVGVWVQNTDASAIYFMIQVRDASGSAQKIPEKRILVQNKAEWQEITYRFTAVEGCAQVQIYFLNYSQTAGKTAYFDDVTFKTIRNLVPNSDLEIANGNVPKNWGTYGTSAGWYASGEGSGAHSGNACIKLSGASGNPDLYSDGIAVSANTNYKLSFFFKSDFGTQHGAPRVQVRSGAWGTAVVDDTTKIGTEAVSPYWNKYTYYFTTPGDMTSAVIRLKGFTNWTAYYDDIVLEKDNLTTLELAKGNGDKLSAIGDNTVIYANARYIPKADLNTAPATLVEAVYKKFGDVKTVLDLNVDSGSSVATPADGDTPRVPCAPFDLTTSVDISEIEDKTGLTIEAFLWDSFSNAEPLIKKVSIS